MTTAAYKQKRNEKSDTSALKEFLVELLSRFTIAIPWNLPITLSTRPRRIYIISLQKKNHRGALFSTHDPWMTTISGFHRTLKYMKER